MPSSEDVGAAALQLLRAIREQGKQVYGSSSEGDQFTFLIIPGWMLRDIESVIADADAASST